MSVDSGPIDGYFFRVGPRLGPNTPLAMRVPAVITNEVLAFVRDVLRDFGQKIQCAENLEVAPRTVFQIAAGRTGEAAAASLLGAIDYRAVIGQANHTGQTEGASQDVLGQPLQSRRVARRQVDAVVDAEAGVPPRSHQIDRFLIDFILSQKQREDIGADCSAMLFAVECSE
jgi:hypothetical protein